MNKFLWISNSGESLPLAYRMENEGKEVAFYLHNDKYSRNYDGILEKTPLKKLKQKVNWADMVIFDMTRTNEKTPKDRAMLVMFGLKQNLPSVFGPVADKIAVNKPVVGNSQFTETMELDRRLGTVIAKKIGLKVPNGNAFRSMEQAKPFLKRNKDLWVLKPNNNDDLDLTYVEKYPGELLQKFDGDLKNRLNGSFILQEKIDGTEVSSEAWWNGIDWVNHNHTLEQKRFMNSDLGPPIGSQSNVVWLNSDSFMRPYFDRLTPFIRKSGYTGPVDINTIVKDGNPYFLEFTPRWGYDASYCLNELCQNDISEFLSRGFQVDWDEGYAASQRLTIPPFPNATGELLSQYALNVPVTVQLDSFYGCDLYNDNGLKCAGADGVIGTMAKRGKSIGGAYGNVYRALKDVKIGSHMQYRTDPVKDAERRYREIERL